VPFVPNDGDLVDLIPRYAPDEALRDERASHTDVQQNVAVDSTVRQTGPGGGE
jgi:hypothetical protein